MNPESVLQNLENNILIGNAQSITDAILNYVNQNRNTQDATTLLNHIQQMVSYQKMKEQTIKQQVPVVEPKVQQDQINKPAAVPSLKEKPEITLYIKPARKTAKYFINYFPPKLYCSPYKYDLMIRLPVEVNDQYDLIFTLIDSETKERITKNTKGEEAYCIERTKTQRKNYLKPGFINATFRLNFSICSFHNFRRPFQISIHLRFKALSKNINNTGGDYNDDQLVYMSEAFSIFARKSGGKDKQANNDDDWGQLSPIGNNTNTTTTTSTTVTEVANEQKGTKENGEKRKRTKATDFTSKSTTTTTEKKKRKKEKQSKPREEPVNNENKQISVSLEDELSIQNSPKSSPLPTTNIKLEIEQNSTDFSSFFENDFSQVLTPNSSHSIPSFDVNNSVQLEELNMINQPQQSLMHIPPQQTNNNCFNYSTPIVPQQQNVDLSMLVYQELLNQQQFNQQQQTANLISQVLANNYSTNNINYNTNNNNNYNNIFNQQQVQIPQQPTMAPEVLLLNQLLWQQQQQQTVQNTTIDPLELARLLFTRNNNNNNTNTNIGNNNNNFLPIDESMYSKYIGGNNNNNYFF